MTNSLVLVLFLAGATLLLAKGLVEPIAWRTVRNLLARDLVKVGLRPDMARRMAEKTLKAHGWEAWW